MPVWSIILISVAAGITALLFAFAVLCYVFAFCKRIDKNPLLKYFTAEDFGLDAESVLIGKLRGFIYENKNAGKRKGVVVFAHGMGPGHIAYTTEIAYFCGMGYAVVAMDSVGCGCSHGKSMRGMYEGANTAVKAVEFAKRQFRGERVYLVGHSWGAYSALCASARVKTDGVVAISAPDKPVRTVVNGISAVTGKPVATLLTPFLWLINALAFGRYGNVSAAKCAMLSGTPTLIIHGDGDKTVTDGNAVYYAAQGANITKYLAKGKAHNPYNTAAAEKKLAELQKNLSEASRHKADGYFDAFDYAAATEEDEEVMRLISDFIAA